MITDMRKIIIVVNCFDLQVSLFSFLAILGSVKWTVFRLVMGVEGGSSNT